MGAGRKETPEEKVKKLKKKAAKAPRSDVTQKLVDDEQKRKNKRKTSAHKTNVKQALAKLPKEFPKHERPWPEFKPAPAPKPNPYGPPKDPSERLPPKTKSMKQLKADSKPPGIIRQLVSKFTKNK